MDLTFDVNLSRCVVGTQTVGGYAGVASCIVLEGFTDHQRVQDTITGNLYVRRVVQLPAFAEPPGRSGRKCDASAGAAIPNTSKIRDVLFIDLRQLEPIKLKFEYGLSRRVQDHESV